MNVLVSLAVVLALALVAYLGVSVAGLSMLFGVVLPYVAIALFLGGVVYRIVYWARSPVPFRIPTTCGQQKTLPWIKNNNLENPHNLVGVVGRMLLEVLFFRSLFRNTTTEVYKEGPKVAYGPNKWLWLFGMVFHWSMLVIIVRHLRLFTEPVPIWVQWIQNTDGFFQVGVPVVYLTTLAFIAALTMLLVRRIYSPQLRYISLLNDHFPLFLLIGIGLSGLILRHFVKADIVGVKEMAIGLISFKPVVVPTVHWFFYVHLMFITVLFAYFPFSKLLHAPGVFMSPTRNLANNTRFVRHINPWNAPVKLHTYEEWEDEFRERMVEVGLPVDKPLDTKAADDSVEA